MEDPIQLFLDFVKSVSPLLQDSELLWLRKKVSVLTLERNEYFIRETQKQKDLGFITKGLIRAFYLDVNDKQQTMRFISENQFVSDYAALLGDRPTKYNFQCLETTVFVVLPFETVQESYAASHQFDAFGRILAEKTCQMYQARLESFLFEAPEQRYLNFIKDSASLYNRVSITHLCTYLGISRQSLTRIRKNLLKPG